MLWILNEKELLFFFLLPNLIFVLNSPKKRTLNIPFVMNFKWKGTFTFSFNFTESNFCFKFNKKRTLNLPFVMNFKWKGTFTFTFTFTINLPSLILVQKNVSFLKYPNGGGGEVVERNGAGAIFSNFWFFIISDNFQPKGTFWIFSSIISDNFQSKGTYLQKRNYWQSLIYIVAAHSIT